MKHNWERDENGNINEWAWEAGFHNGVFCVDCGKSVCVHCNPDYMEFDDTNADRIRAMTDEELAGIFLRADFCKCCEHEKGGVCNFICAYPNIPIYEGCKQAALAWMKQPVEVDT